MRQKTQSAKELAGTTNDDHKKGRQKATIIVGNVEEKPIYPAMLLKGARPHYDELCAHLIHYKAMDAADQYLVSMTANSLYTYELAMKDLEAAKGLNGHKTYYEKTDTEAISPLNIIIHREVTALKSHFEQLGIGIKSREKIDHFAKVTKYKQEPGDLLASLAARKAQTPMTVSSKKKTA